MHSCTALHQNKVSGKEAARDVRSFFMQQECRNRLRLSPVLPFGQADRAAIFPVMTPDALAFSLQPCFGSVSPPASASHTQCIENKVRCSTTHDARRIVYVLVRSICTPYNQWTHFYAPAASAANHNLPIPLRPTSHFASVFRSLHFSSPVGKTASRCPHLPSACALPTVPRAAQHSTPAQTLQ